MSVARFSLIALAGMSLLAAQPVQAQSPAPKMFVEVLGGAVVPTFDIADVAKTGSMVGGTIGYNLSPRLVLMGEFDYGMHKDKATGDVTIKTLHYMGKLGYSLTGPREKGWEALVNLGAGAVSFDVDGAPNVNTYFAINAGAKFTYHLSPSLGFVISPQGDIAFSKKAELNTTNAWVWPVSAGFRVKF
jgi:hypothetical protein